MQIQSPAFSNGERIPVEYTKDGADKSVPLQWSDAPHSTQQFALICDDPDAPMDEPFVHWVIYNIPPDVNQLPEDLPRREQPGQPDGAAQGVNNFPSDNIGYGGPQPPKGHGTHHYHFKLYALDTALNLPPKADKKSLLQAMEGHILDQAELIGTYER